MSSFNEMIERATERGYEVSSLGRPLDPRYPSNLIAAILVVVFALVAAGVALLNGLPIREIALWGVSGAFSWFIAWALGRELDPDHILSSFLAGGFAIVGLLILGPPNFLIVALGLVLARLLSRSTGLAFKVFDSIAVIVILLGTLILEGTWLMGLITAVAFALDALLDDPYPAHWAFAGVSLALSIGTVIVSGFPPFPAVPVWMLVSAAVVVVLSLGYVVLCSDPISLSDATQKPLHKNRIRATIVIILLVALTSLWYGEGGLAIGSTVWAALLGSALGFGLATWLGIGPSGPETPRSLSQTDAS
ncbi:MAG: hypothetical protein GYB68_12915 [Chloroflexi bacterium]|nr:hypothetical protein [Chloroflexota bacterium]